MTKEAQSPNDQEKDIAALRHSAFVII